MTRLLQFRAGRCERRGQTNIVDPLPAKGLLYVERNDEDGGLNHLCFKDLESGAVVDDFILFAGDASFKKVLVPTSATARVYVLCFSSSNQKVLYWLQDVDSASDTINVTRLNQLIEDDDQMPVEWQEGTAEQPAQGSSMQTEPNNNPTPAQMNELQSIIERFSRSNPLKASPAFNLSDIVNVETLDSTLFGPDQKEVLESLSEHLPIGLRSEPESLRKVFRSQDFRMAVKSFDEALRNSGGGLTGDGGDDEGLRMFFEHGLQLNEGWDSVEGYVEAIIKNYGSQEKSKD